MKLSEKEIEQLDEQQEGSAMKAVADALLKLAEKPTGVEKIVQQNEKAIAAILNALPKPEQTDYRKIAEAIVAAIPKPQPVVQPMPQPDTSTKEVAKSIQQLAAAIAGKPSQFIFDVQRKSTGEIHRVIVKPYNENGSV